MKAITHALVSASVRGPWNSVKETLRPKSTSYNKYLVCLAHPDDEILAGALCRRLVDYSKNPNFMVLTNGGGNTNGDRLRELKNSYNLIGFSGEIDCLFREKEIYRLAESSRRDVSPKKNLDNLSRLVNEGIVKIGEKISKNSVNRVITTSYEGGHFIHDINNFMVVRAAEKSGAEVYEVSQYSLVPHKNSSIDDFHKAINDPSMSVDSYANYFLGIPLNVTKGLNDSALGARDGKVDVSLSEFLMKNAMRKEHKSQNGSLCRSLKNITRADFSKEIYSLVPKNRNFSCLPNRAFPLYELCDWRLNHLTFETFKKLVKKVDSI